MNDKTIKKETYKFMAYDSTADTLLHMKRVNDLMSAGATELLVRAAAHDLSKLQYPEKEHFDRETPLLAGLTYGTPEYNESLNRLRVALNHHYANNSHHPEHYENGIDGMNLFDVLEMFFDWKAAGERNEGGCIYKSIEMNKDRHEMSEQLQSIFKNTAKYLGYVAI